MHDERQRRSPREPALAHSLHPWPPRCAKAACDFAAGAGAALAASPCMDPSTARKHMIEHHIRARGVRDARVLDAIAAVPREAFLPAELAELAYEDRPLPIEAGQTISQPYIVALMTEALALQARRHACSRSARARATRPPCSRGSPTHVYTVERIAELADAARERLARARLRERRRPLRRRHARLARARAVRRDRRRGRRSRRAARAARSARDRRAARDAGRLGHARRSSCASRASSDDRATAARTSAPCSSCR